MSKSRSLNKPSVSYKNRYDTNFASKRKVFKGQPYPNGTAKGDSDLVVICTEGVKDFNEAVANIPDKSENGINPPVEEIVADSAILADNLSIETNVFTDGLSEDYGFSAVDDETESVEDVEINDTDTETVFSGVSIENTKKELIEYAAANNIEVKGWWGKQKILDVLTD
tara:strand:- start:6307 stop:6813 length:507 start_codon:yes stop_codon:yes gene_type:complete